MCLTRTFSGPPPPEQRGSPSASSAPAEHASKERGARRSLALDPPGATRRVPLATGSALSTRRRPRAPEEARRVGVVVVLPFPRRASQPRAWLSGPGEHVGEAGRGCPARAAQLGSRAACPGVSARR